MVPAEQGQVRQFVLDDHWTLPIMRSEGPTLRDKIAAVGAALVASNGIQNAALEMWWGTGPLNPTPADAG
jgi:hypothetical protein